MRGRLGQDAANDPTAQIWQAQRLTLFVRDKPTIMCTTILLSGPDFHAHLHQLSRQVPRLRGIETTIHEPFPCATGRDENLPTLEAMQVVPQHRDRDNTSGWIGHQTTNTGKLANLLKFGFRGT